MDNNWISIDDRLPVADKEVLIYDGCDIWIGWYTKSLCYDDGSIAYLFSTETWCDDKVTHWVELPEVPNHEK